MKKILFFLLFLIISQFSFAQTLSLYGGNNYNNFIGYLNVSKYD